MVPATVAAGIGPTSITVDPSAKYAYVKNNGSNDVTQYSIGVTRALTALLPRVVSNMAVPQSIVISAGAAPVQAVAQ